MIALTLTSKIDRQQLTHAAGPLEVGRGPQRGNVPRVVIQDGFVSRDHLRLEEPAPGRLRVENISQRTRVVVDKISIIPPGGTAEFGLPVRLDIGETTIDLDLVRSESSEAYLTVSAPVLPEFASAELPHLFATPPSVEQIVSWLEPVVALLSVPTEAELYRQTAQTIVDRIGLDSAAVLIRTGETVWKTVGYANRESRASGRTISHAMLRRVVQDKRTFYLSASAIGKSDSLTGIHSLVASPVLNDRQEVVGAVTGNRMVHSQKGEINALVAQIVQLLAAAVGVGKRRFDREVEADRLRVAKEAAEQADRTKSQFLATVSHELRTPLTTIIGYSEMVLDQLKADGHPQYLDDVSQIHTAGQNLLRLINDLLDLSKIEAGKLEITREQYDLPSTLRALVASVEPQAKKNGNRVELSCPDLGTTVGDASRVRQAVLNLVANACKFTSNGLVRVTASRLTQDGQDWIAVRVEDTGIGMTPEEMSRLFQPFTQVDSSAARKQSGTGLGLAISLKLAQAMGGRILVESELGKGSVFTLVVRAVVPEASAELTV